VSKTEGETGQKAHSKRRQFAIFNSTSGGEGASAMGAPDEEVSFRKQKGSGGWPPGGGGKQPDLSLLRSQKRGIYVRREPSKEGSRVHEESSMHGYWLMGVTKGVRKIPERKWGDQKTKEKLIVLGAGA